VLDDLAIAIRSGRTRALDDVAAVADANAAYLASPVGPRSLPIFLATSFNAAHIVGMLRAQSDPKLRSLGTAITDFYALGPRAALADLRSKERRVHRLVEGISGASADGLVDVEVNLPILGPKAFGWYTTYAEGDEESGCWPSRSLWDQRGDATRDVLGLVHYGSTTTTPFSWEPVLLATYVVPRSALGPAVVFARPNGLDAIGGTRFKARFGKASGTTAEWGRTVNLAKLGSRRPYRGGREVVVENFIPLTPVRFTIAGALWVPRGDVLGIGDTNFEAVVAGKREWRTRARKFLAL
jgi:hypothetical protein